ncbi:hypothetical protein A9261_18875 [Vibrio tasmaniensis]|nr:hypothetical protein A9261_18875 [Vibrio tasmaniensis]
MGISKKVSDSSIKLTVVCITYNHERYIRETLDSILSQNVDFDFEVIINDDASVDNTVQIIKEYKKKHPEIIKLKLHSENQFKKGLRHDALFDRINEARGEYVSYCEGDDFWLDRDKLARQVSFLDKNKDFFAHVFDVQAVSGNGTVLYTSKLDKLGLKNKVYKSSYFELKNNLFVLLQSICHRKPSKLEMDSFFNKSINTDLLLQTLLLDSFPDSNIYVSKHISSAYRVHDDGVWSQRGNKSRFYESMHSLLVQAQYFSQNGNSTLEAIKMLAIVKNMIKSINGRQLMKIIVRNND